MSTLVHKCGTHHCKEEAEKHKKIVVSRERYSHAEHKLTETGDHQNPHTANSGGERHMQVRRQGGRERRIQEKRKKAT